MKKEKNPFVIIVIVLIILGGIKILPQLGISNDQKHDLEVLHSDYISAKDFAENKLEFQLVSQCDPQTYSDLNEGAIIKKVVKNYSDYIDIRYEYYKEEIKNADYSSGYRYDSENYIKDINNYNPYIYIN